MIGSNLIIFSPLLQEEGDERGLGNYVEHVKH